MMPVSSNSEGGGRMKKEEMALVAPCGINCGDCGVHLAKDIQKLIDSLVARGFEKERLNEESLPCAGCRH
jgi:hypothetical protein